MHDDFGIEEQEQRKAEKRKQLFIKAAELRDTKLTADQKLLIVMKLQIDMMSCDFESDHESKEFEIDDVLDFEDSSSDKVAGRSALSPGMRWRILEAYNFTCQGCGRSAPNVELHVDHKVPIANGGTYDMENLHVLCAKCNMGKGSKQPTTETLEAWGYKC